MVRLGIGALAQRSGVAQSVTVGELPLFLGVTLAAQNGVIWQRAQALGVSAGTHRPRVSWRDAGAVNGGAQSPHAAGARMIARAGIGRG